MPCCLSCFPLASPQLIHQQSAVDRLCAAAKDLVDSSIVTNMCICPGCDSKQLIFQAFQGGLSFISFAGCCSFLGIKTKKLFWGANLVTFCASCPLATCRSQDSWIVGWDFSLSQWLSACRSTSLPFVPQYSGTDADFDPIGTVSGQAVAVSSGRALLLVLASPWFATSSLLCSMFPSLTHRDVIVP